jgi:hypothetical protein
VKRDQGPGIGYREEEASRYPIFGIGPSDRMLFER